MYPETRSDFDFCLDTIKAFCASHFILKRPVTDREADFETAMVDVENGCLRFQRGNANLQQCPGGLRDGDLGWRSEGLGWLRLSEKVLPGVGLLRQTAVVDNIFGLK